MRIKTIITVIAGFIFAIASPFVAIAVNETPHNASKTVSCGNCHGKALLYSPFWGGSYTPKDIDDTVYNKICLQCHTKASGPYTSTEAPLARTHSSLNTDNGYGNWTRECRDCHNPHYQRQSIYGYKEASNLYLARGTITLCGAYNSVNNTTTLTYSGITYKSGWNATKLLEKTGSYRRAILYPNEQAAGYNYPVKAIGANTITVEGDATALYQWISPPTTFAVMHGQYIKDKIDISADHSKVYKTVKFFDKTGAKSFADGDTTYDGVCEVCHTLTTYHKNSSAGDHTHYAATNCTTCHLHAEGFKGAGCNACHGFPPPPLATTPLPTGSTTAGAHVLHATTKGYACAKCHYNSAGGSGTHNNNIITLGFVNLLGAYTGGSYDGQATANYQSSDAGTTVSKLGSKTCGGIYCHSNVQPNGGTGSPGVYATPAWDNVAPNNVVCGSCHKSDGVQGKATLMDSGSHTAHVQSNSYACSICHSGVGSGTVKHVDNNIDIAFTSLNPSGTYSQSTNTPGNGYGTCSTTYCHGAGTPQWGGSLADTAECDSCHGGNALSTNAAGLGPITLNNHPDHMNQAAVLGTNYECAQCHKTTVSAGNDRLITGTVHVDHTKDVSMLLGGIWTAGPKTCTSAYCHSSGKGTYANPPAWDSATALGCNGCHGTGNALGRPDYANAGAGLPNANSHLKHAPASSDCNTCHTNTTTTGTAIKASSILHTNQTLNVNFDTTKAGASAAWTAGTKTCSTTYCHGSGAPVWGSAMAADCTSCHGGNATSAAPMTLVNHPDHMNQAAVLGTNYKCAQCHNTTVSAADDRVITGAVHVNQTKDVSMLLGGTWTAGTKACTSAYCHSSGKGTYVNPPAWDSATALGCNGCHGTGNALGRPDYANAGAGLPNANSHLKHAPASSDCNTCHTNTTTTGTAIKASSILHTNQTLNVNFDTTKAGASAAWTAGTKTCSTTYCHGSATPVWGAALTCAGCHKASNALPQSHGKHYENAPAVTSNQTGRDASAALYIFRCGNCHNPAATTHAGGMANPPNRASEISFSGGGTYTQGATNLTDPEGFKYTTGGTCATTACHQDGQGGVPLQTATWQGTVTNPGECVYCHKGNAATTNAAWRMSTGKHTQHMNQAAVLGTNFECVRCHNTTVSAGSDRAITNKDNHVNGTRTVSFSNTGTWTAATFICSSMYCHSSGQATPNYRTVAAWNSATTYDCKACHGADAAFVSKAGEPNYANGGAGAANANSHDAHVSIAGDCDTCHTNTTTTGTSIKAGSLLHINTLREVTFNTTKAGASATYTAATKTCSTISCHGGGSAQWGAILGCSGCHSYDTVAGSWGSNPQAIEGFGAHAKHIDHIKARFSVTLSATTDTFGTGAAAKVCGTCHTNNSANHSNSTRTINFGDGTYKEGGSTGFSFLFDPAAPGTNPPLYNGVTGNSSAVNPKSCSATGCHFTTTPVWSSY